MQDLTNDILAYYAKKIFNYELEGESSSSRMQQFTILVFIVLLGNQKPDETISIMRIGDILGVDYSTVSRQASNLELRGLVSKTKVAVPGQRGTMVSLRLQESAELNKIIANAVGIRTDLK